MLVFGFLLRKYLRYVVNSVNHWPQASSCYIGPDNRQTVQDSCRLQTEKRDFAVLAEGLDEPCFYKLLLCLSIEGYKMKVIVSGRSSRKLAVWPF